MKSLLLQLIDLILFVTCFVSFGWAVFRFFRYESQTSLSMKMISHSGTLFFVVYVMCLIFYFQSQFLMGVLAMFLFLASLILFWMTVQANRQRPLTIAFSDDVPQHLVEIGPYRRIRHPFYTSYTLFWIGSALATTQHIMWGAVLIMFVLYLRAALMEERKFMASPLANTYAGYCSRTGRFFPRIF